MFAAPAEGTLKDFMEFAETGFADHEQSPPNQRTHATEHYAKLINRNRRYGRFRHASSLPKPTRTPSNLTPRNLPLSGATGWWSNLRTFTVERFSPATGGGRTPTERYLSCALLNRITYYELDILRRRVRSVLNKLGTDALYGIEAIFLHIPEHGSPGHPIKSRISDAAHA